jgi:hypothetical protein
MTKAVPRLLVGILCAIAAVPSGAAAATATTTNACNWSVDGVWRNLDITLRGTGVPNPVAPGGGVGLRSVSVGARLPDWVPEYGYNFGLLKAGYNELPSRVWVAIAAGGATGAAHVYEMPVTASTTITVDDEARFVSATPIDVSIPLPDTAWTAQASGEMTFRQAPAGALPPLPVGNGGATVAVSGSVFIYTTIGGSTRLTLDCQPGRGNAAGDGLTPATAAPFETIPIGTSGGAPKPPVPALPAGALRVTARGVPVRLACPAGGPDCEGTARLSASGRRIAQRPYSVPAGRRETVRLRLTAAGARLMRGRERAQVRLEAVPPAPGTAATRRLSLRAAVRPALRRASVERGGVVLALSCPRGGEACRGDGEVRVGRTIVARGSYRVAAGRRGEERLALTRRGRSLLGEGRVAARVELTPAAPAPPLRRRLEL